MKVQGSRLGVLIDTGRIDRLRANREGIEKDREREEKEMMRKEIKDKKND